MPKILSNEDVSNFDDHLTNQGKYLLSLLDPEV